MLGYNHGPVLEELIDRLDSALRSPSPSKRQSLPPDPCLLDRLPSTSFIQREAEDSISKAELKQLRRTPTPPSPQAEDHEDAEEQEVMDTDLSKRRGSDVSTTSSASTRSPKQPLSKHEEDQKAIGSWKDPQPFEVLRAVEQKNIVYLMEIRDKAFHLLLRKWGDATPLLHAMRIGTSHREVAIVLLGAFSRYINHLDESDLRKPKTKTLLKALRTNLKLAIDYGLSSSQSDLTASFMQTLIMSEGDKWVSDQTLNVSLALRAGTSGEPVRIAETSVRRYATKELGKAELIATLEDYVANATVDLLMMAAWSIALHSITGEPIPISYFARDDRVYKAFVERLDKDESAIRHKCTRRLRWQFRVLRAVLEGRNITYRRRVELLAGELDSGGGV
ncbi:hypothetical protein E1B28_004445 [Marasmius oreades]|nr:uncharacterized protein E1B28_004445 [Marasmius oreades]KAG7097055.1 hypothetical protein E1B28_004445 [Marasmius oreades]